MSQVDPLEGYKIAEHLMLDNLLTIHKTVKSLSWCLTASTLLGPTTLAKLKEVEGLLIPTIVAMLPIEERAAFVRDTLEQKRPSLRG